MFLFTNYLLLFSHQSWVTLRPHELHHGRPLCPSPSPRVCPNSYPLHRWCHTAISCSDILFSCPQCFLPSGNFPMSHLFASDDQNTGASASASVLPMSIKGWFPLSLTGLIPLLSKGLSRVFSGTTVRMHQFFVFCLLYGPALTLVHDHWEDYSLDYRDPLSAE